jgi:LPXTG-motif cell wall-anchored protein
MPKKVSKIALVAFALAAAAVMAYGQTTSNSATTTTTGKYRIALIEPVEGSSIAADQVRVVLTPNANAMGDENTQVDVFLDDQQKGTLKTNETEFRVSGVRPGPHKLVLIARNPATDAQFDRREINFVATGVGSTTTGVSSVSENALGAHVPPAVSSTERKQSYTAKDGSTSTQVAENEMPAKSGASSSTSSSSSTVNPPPAPAPAPAPATESSSSAYSNRTYSNNPNPSAPSTTMSTSPSSSSSYSSRTTGGTDNEQLPKTGTSEGLLAIAGAGLLVTGALLRRHNA